MKQSTPCYPPGLCRARSQHQRPGQHVNVPVGIIRKSALADDAVAHCVSEGQAQYVRQEIADRMAEVGLLLHPCKTKIVYCKDGKWKLRYEHTSFTFLGFAFRARAARSKHGVNFTSFLPAISKDALKRISGEVRRWRLHRQIGLDFREVAKRINPIVCGWMQYYGAFYHSALCPLLLSINAYLMRWIRKKYKRLRPFKRSMRAGNASRASTLRLFAHWGNGSLPLGYQDDRSPVTRECHAGISGVY